MKNHLNNLRINKDGGIKAYLHEFKTIQCQFILISTSMSEEEFVEILLVALLDSYEPLITTLIGCEIISTFDGVAV